MSDEKNITELAELIVQCTKALNLCQQQLITQQSKTEGLGGALFLITELLLQNKELKSKFTTSLSQVLQQPEVCAHPQFQDTLHELLDSLTNGQSKTVSWIPRVITGGKKDDEEKN